MQRESARMWQMQSRILVRAEFCACGQWHRGESAEFAHRPQSNEIRAKSRITAHSESYLNEELPLSTDHRKVFWRAA